MSQTDDKDTGDQTQPAAVSTFALPSDPLLGSQWNLNNTGQTGGLPGIDLNVFDVWDDYTGDGISVGVIDDGVQHTHADLSANYDTTRDFDAATGDNDAMAQGSDRHGTAVAGIIAADDNGFGSVGVAFDAEIVGYRMSFGTGTGTQILNNLNRQIDVDISNNSWGFNGYFYDSFSSYAFDDHGAAIQNAVANGRGGLGTIFNFAAGNSRTEGQDVNYHSFQNSRFTNAIAAAEDDGEITFYSTPGASLLTTAPVAGGGGYGGVITTDRSGSAGYASGEFTSGFNGTSAATPMVSGVTALMLEANPNLGYRDVQEILAYSSRQIDPSDPGWQINGADNWNGGGAHVSHDFGFGLVDALAAVRLAESWTKQSVLSNEASVSAFDFVNTPVFSYDTIERTITVTDPVQLQWVEVHLDVSHTRIGDLIVTLESPDGTVSTLVDRPGRTSSNHVGSYQDDIDFVLTSTQQWGEDAVGDWTISVSDVRSGYIGTFHDWRLTLYGDAPSGDDDYIFTNEYGVFTASDASRQVLNDSGGHDRINAAAVTSDVDISLVSGYGGHIGGTGFLVASATDIEDLYAGDGNDTLTGNALDNLITGARGNDLIDGGAGNDTLTGGQGSDSFVVDSSSGSDLISDFTPGEDALRLVGISTFSDRPGLINATSTIGDDLQIDLGDGETLTLANVSPDALDTIDVTIETVFRAVDDLYVIDEDTSITFNPVTNDLDALHASLSSWGASDLPGTVEQIDTNTLRFTPDADYFGTVAINYSIASAALTSSATISIVVQAVNDAPDAVDDIVELPSGTASLIDVISNDVDIDGDAISVIAVSAEHGDVAIGPDNQISYTRASQSGTDTITYTISDGSLTDTASVAVSFSNNAPNAVNDTAAALEDATVNINVLSNDTDSDGDALNVVAASAVNGTVTIEADGSLSYTGHANFHGGDTISYTISDGELTSSAEVTVTVAAVNDAPAAQDDVAATDEDVSVSIDVLGNDTDIDGDALTILSASASNGTVTIEAGGTLSYAGHANFNGTDTISYSITDGELTDTAEVTVSVNAVNDTPLAANDIAATDEDEAVNIDVLNNDADIDGDALTIVSATASNGTVVIEADGTLSYTGDANFHGADTISYTISDGDLTSSADVVVTINAVNDAPVVNGETATTDDDAILTLDVLANDSDVDGQALSLVSATAGNGTASIEADGKLTYQAHDNFSGVDTITYTVSDGIAETVGTVAVTVTTDDNLVFASNLGETHYVGHGDDTVHGGQSSDILVGGDGHDSIYGNGGGDLIDDQGTDDGDDWFSGGTGDDTLVGRRGNDTLHGGLDDDQLLGHSGADQLHGNQGNDRLEAGADNDTLIGGDGHDTSYGHDGDDLIDDQGADIGHDWLSGGAGDDTLIGRVGNDTMHGGLDDDRLLGHSGADQLHGNQGNDRLEAGADNDTLIGGDGHDTSYGHDGDDLIDDQGADIGHDWLSGGAGNDTLIGRVGNDTLHGGLDDDRLLGHSGADQLHGNQGNDRLEAGADNDTLIGGDGHDTSYGHDGDDLIDDQGADIGHDWLSGGAGNDTLIGRVGNDTLYGGSDDDRMLGHSGDDLMYGDQGEDRLEGGADNDTLIGGNGHDTSYGHDGDDLIDDQGADIGHDWLSGGAGNDTLMGRIGNDTLHGGGDDDRLLGHSGDDLIYGDQGNDRLEGGNGDDTLNGGAGSDTLYGNGGDDLLSGGADADMFVFTSDTGNDVVTDFEASDLLHVAAFDFGDLDDLLAASSQVGGNLVIALDQSNTLTLLGVAPDDLSSDNFEF